MIRAPIKDVVPQFFQSKRPDLWSGMPANSGLRLVTGSMRMDPITRVRDYLLDSVGHMTYPGHASFHPATQRWFVPIYCRTERRNIVVGDVEVDRDGQVYAPSR